MMESGVIVGECEVCLIVCSNPERSGFGLDPLRLVGSYERRYMDEEDEGSTVGPCLVCLLFGGRLCVCVCVCVCVLT